MAALTERLNTALADRYRIERRLGEGGMATVYLAEDLKHDRRVALKVLKPELAAVLGAERFVQEIKTTAALQHPHILPLFDSGTADGFLFYVMPYIEGETLRDRLNRETQLGIEEAVRIAREVADALDYAHRHGIIHRDIKPENILLHDGRPMVADFGIALAVSAAAGGRMTETGTSLGTPHYMSPEQATADRELTARSDIYSLGIVLYEMLAGDPPHTGSSAQQVVMKIIADAPRPVNELRRSVPPNVAAAVAKSLEKVPADRFDSARAFAAALADPHFGAETAAVATAPAGTWRIWLRDGRTRAALAAIGVLAVGVLFPWRASPSRTGESGMTLFSIVGPVDSSVVGVSWLSAGPASLRGPVVAPDGRHVAFTVVKSAGKEVFVRALDAFEFERVPGDMPFFSPDGSAVGFLRDSDVWSASLADMVPAHVGTLPERWWDVYAPAWHPDGRILVGGSRGLWAFPARGGEPSLLIPADSSVREHFESVGVLSDGRLLLHIESRAAWHVEVASADGTERVRILPDAERAWIIGDILIFSRSGQYRATRFDVRRLRAIGEPVALPEVPTMRLSRSIAWVDAGDVARLQPVWVSHGGQGQVTPTGVPAAEYRWPRLSPDGGRIAISGRIGELRVIDIARRTTTRIHGESEPVWSADGQRVFASRGNRPLGGLVAQIADGSRAPDTLLALNNGDAWPTSASPDGNWLAYYGATLGSGDAEEALDQNDLFFMDLATRESRRVRLRGEQRGARFSPDGRWLAYQSTESGREEVHIRPWPAMDASYVVSNGGGTEPVWSADGGTLYYRRQNDVMAVAVHVRDGAIERTAPQLLFTGDFSHDHAGDQSYDIAPDGRFLMLQPVPGGRVIVQVALNWIDEIRARLDRSR